MKKPAPASVVASLFVVASIGSSGAPSVVDGFALLPTPTSAGRRRSSSSSSSSSSGAASFQLPRKPDTSLGPLLEVPDQFFTFTFPILGVMLSVSKNFGRLRMEERAWEQRVEEADAEPAEKVALEERHGE